MFPAASVLYRASASVWTNCPIALASSQFMQLIGLLLYQLFAQGQFYYMQIIDINWGRMDLLRGLDSSFTIWYVHFYYIRYLLLEYSFVWELCRVCQGWDNVNLFGFWHTQPSSWSEFGVHEATREFWLEIRELKTHTCDFTGLDFWKFKTEKIQILTHGSEKLLSPGP